MDDIINQIKKARDIKDSTLNQYKSSFKSLCKLLDNEDCSIDDFKDTDKVLKEINKLDKITTKKNKLTSIIVFMSSYGEKYKDEIEIYRNELKKLNELYDQQMKTQTKSKKQQDNWIDYDDIITIVRDLKRQMVIMKLNKKKSLTKKERNVLQRYAFLVLFLEYPYRNDFHSLKKISETEYKKIENEHKGNWIISNKNNKPIKIVLHNYKTSKKYGMIEVGIPSKIGNVLKLHNKHNEDSEYLFSTINNQTKPFSSNAFTKYVQSIFYEYYPNKSIGTQLLRNIIASHLNKDEPSIEQKEKENDEIEKKFLHSKDVNEKVYSKKD